MMEVKNGEIKPTMQRMASAKRAILIPQKTNIRLDLESLATNGGGTVASDVKVRRPSIGKTGPDTGRSGLSRQPSIREDSQHQFDRNISIFLDESPTVGLTKEDSKVMRTRVIEEMYRIQQRQQITTEERQKLYQLAITMDAPKLARKLVSESRDLDATGGSFLTGDYLGSHSTTGIAVPHGRERRLSKDKISGDNRGNEANEDDLFCKAFDEVERIRTRIITRANAPTSPVRTNHTQSHQTPPSTDSESNGHVPLSSRGLPSSRVTPRDLISPRIAAPIFPTSTNGPSNVSTTGNVTVTTTSNLVTPSSIGNGGGKVSGSGGKSPTPPSSTQQQQSVRAQAAWTKVYPEGVPPSSASKITEPVISPKNIQHQASNFSYLSPVATTSHHHDMHKLGMVKRVESHSGGKGHESVNVHEALDSILGSQSSSHPNSRSTSERKRSYNRLLVDHDHDQSTYSFPDSFLQEHSHYNQPHSGPNTRDSGSKGGMKSQHHLHPQSHSKLPIHIHDQSMFSAYGYDSVPLTQRSDFDHILLPDAIPVQDSPGNPYYNYARVLFCAVVVVCNR